MEQLPAVDFGKYNGQPITSLLADTKYVDWLTTQPWFTNNKKYSHIYNICVNQTIVSPNQSSRTPEHNKLQNIFLDHKNIEQFIKYIIRKHNLKNYLSKFPLEAEFEGKFNWDVIIKDLKLGEQFYNMICIEIKPLLGDDYPNVLRKMKQQIKLISEERIVNNNGYKTYSRKNTDKHLPVLLIGKFESSTTTKEELIKIFKNSDIDIEFVDDIFNNNKLIALAKLNKERDELLLKLQEIEAKIKAVDG